MAANDDNYTPHIMDADLPEPWSADQQMFDSAFNNPDLHDLHGETTPFDYNQYLNNDAFSSPAPGQANLAGYPSPAKVFPGRTEQTSAPLPQHSSLKPRSHMSSSPDSSSQDSSSESSGRRKRRMTSSNSSPSALFDGCMDGHGHMDEWSKDPMAGLEYAGNPRDSMLVKREIETDVDTINKNLAANLEVHSSSSSPALFNFSSPDQTVAPSKLEQHSADSQSIVQRSAAPKETGFFIGSRDESPMSGLSGSQDASPGAMFGGTHSPAAFSSNDMFQNMPVWNGSGLNSAFQTHPWQNELSPTQRPMSYPVSDLTVFQNSILGAPLQAHLSIQQDGAKSRVETQINIKLLLDPLPLGTTRLHLPTHSVSKPKLLAKEIIKAPDTLELHTSLVCASAMEKPELMKRALERAAGFDSNTRKSQPRRPSQGDVADDDPDDPDKPANGGEVRICQNCVQRERKRAARKRVKKQEDEEAWAEYEYERVIVFNDKEYKEWQPVTPPKNDGSANSITYSPNAMQIEVPMRIACYCRHQGEKTGFRVIFTIKDHQNKVVAQAMTSPILITDDHKTQGAPLPSASGMPTDPTQPFNAPLLTSTEQPDLQASFHRRPYHSTNDLQGLQTNWLSSKSTSRPSNASSQGTSTTMTPRNLSRQTSPVATQTGPNKKRKSSSTHHHKLPRELTMTRVSAASSPGASAEAVSMANAMPPTSAPQSGPYMTAHDPQFSMMNPLTIPPHNSGPSTPGSNGGLVTPGQRSGSIDNMAQMFYSVPNSAHHSRAPSPSMGRQPMGAFTPTNMSNVVGTTMSMIQPQMDSRNQVAAPPQIYKVTPHEYSKSGGIEVSCLGSNFTRNMDILFGDTVATTTTFWNSQLLTGFTAPAVAGPSATFTYVDDEDQRICEMALRILCQKQSGNAKTDDYRGFARHIVGMAAGWSAGSMSGGNMQQRSASGFDCPPMDTEEMLLRCLDLIDMDDSPHPPRFNLKNKTGATFLSLASSLGYGRIVAGLLARGANPDTRDRGGYTPLMMAAMHGHIQIVRRLILKGADPMLRSLPGYLASDFAVSRELLDALQRVRSHRRTRSAGSASFPMRSRASSIASAHSMWESSTPSHVSDYSSAEADYEDEGEESEEPEETPSVSVWPPSRRGSAKEIRPLSQPTQQPAVPVVAAAMNAWRENLSAQIHSFQQNMHWNLPNLQLPALPPLPNLPDYQAHPMVRRISSLVPHRSPPRTPSSSGDETATPPASNEYRWKDLFSTPAAPPAYEEIYPENADKDTDVKKMSVAQAAADHLLDEACAEQFDAAESSDAKSSLNLELGKKSLTKEEQEQVRRAHSQKLKRIRSDRNLFFIWIPLLLLILCAMLRSKIPQLLAAASAVFGAVQERTTSGRIVEVA
ncbi:SPT3 Dosage dependent suppressor of Ty-induced promoter mutations-like protein [Neofusicoccum ribis]|uniref:SPT3 Dosage dependent suppressor of Ty-induced promoter mutations-like protein n=1 Tax=Neofusicoccum ribis TaxID=45134 RepID=A0ABR3TBK0_9PEZI